jgi:hypothetical protein
MTTECNQSPFVFHALGRREVVARFDGGKEPQPPILAGRLDVHDRRPAVVKTREIGDCPSRLSALATTNARHHASEPGSVATSARRQQGQPRGRILVGGVPV